MKETSVARKSAETKKSSNSGKKRVEFKVAAPSGSAVYVAGTFNDWKPESSQLKEVSAGEYRGIRYLPRGRHEYKFVVDGVWYTDPSCEQCIPNSMGTTNSVREV